MRAGYCVDELGVDPHPVLVPLHRAFEDIADAQFLADLLGVDALALEGEGGIARDHETVADAREVGGEVFRDAVGEIGLVRIVRKIGERQHHDGEMRGVGRPEAVHAEDVPAARSDQDEEDDDTRGEGRRDRTLLRRRGLGL
jgi:hypothetical protein